MKSFAAALLALSTLAWGAGESPHGALKLDCALCHSTESWTLREQPGFDHERDSAWPLEGQHAGVACISCHADLRFAETETRCAGCHLDPHAGSLGDQCQDCHGPERWIDADRLRRRHDRSLFPLAGAHGRLACTSCHQGTGAAQFAGTPLDCAACHLRTWQSTTRPPHKASDLGTGCKDCHGLSRWTDTPGFRHGAFPLQGAHASAACTACHAGGIYQGTPSDCWSCHQADYQDALNPDHGAGQYPQTCAGCHSTAAWSPASLDHSLTSFPLAGAHANVSCAACHVSGQYAGTPSACQACHLDDYQATSDPNHAAAGFPVDCASCHNSARWEGATFNHDQQFFPIYSGSHRNEWTSCSECHGNAGDFADFSCLGCHEHSQSAMNSQHNEVGGYVYDSQACLQCHPSGTAGDSIGPRQRWRGPDADPRRLLR